MKKTGRIKTWFLPVIMLIGVFLTVLFFTGRKAQAPQTDNSQTEAKATATARSFGFRIFTGKEFEQLYNSFAYPNTLQINEDTPITNNTKADQRLRELAVKRGYKLRSAPVTDTFVEVQKDMLLQQRAAKPWIKMKKQASKDGIELSLTAAYRSAEDEKTIFLNRLKAISLDDIAAGKADNEVNAVLDHIALPGYSRHHTGYTVDVACDSDMSVKFENSICSKWLGKNNYLNAKTFGWMPSYPPGAGRQGPLPEAWEYVWVGTDALK